MTSGPAGIKTVPAAWGKAGRDRGSHMPARGFAGPGEVFTPDRSELFGQADAKLGAVGKELGFAGSSCVPLRPGG